MSIVRSGVMRDTMASGVWMAIRMLALACWLFLVAHLLPPDEFGWLAGVLGVCAVCTLAAPGGIPYLFFADAHRNDRDLPKRWSEALGCIALLSPALTLAAVLFVQAWAVSPVPLLSVVGLVAVEILCGSVVQSAALLAHARGHLAAAAGLPAGLMIGRTIGVGVLVMLGPQALSDYLAVHILATLMVAFAAWRFAQRVVALTARPRKPSRETMRDAWAYALMGAGTLVGGELDKPLVGRIAGLAVGGYYAPAYRICAAMATPATALAASLLPRWSRHVAARRIGDLLNSFLRAAAWVVSLGLLAAIALRWVLDHAPIEQAGLYPATWSLMHGLAWLAAALGLHQLAGTALIAVNRPLVRATIDICGLGLLAVLMAIGYGRWGVTGLVAGCLLAEALTAMCMTAAFVHRAVRLIKGSGEDLVETTGEPASPASVQWRSGELERPTVCLACGNTHLTPRYADLEDLLGDISGRWGFLVCTSCDALHLDPRPSPEAIGKAYPDHYVTHEDGARAHDGDNGSGPVWRLANGYLNGMFNAGRVPASNAGRWLIPLVWPLRQQLDYFYRHLGRVPGRLLDVGCGNGAFLLRAREAGWVVEGIEPDPKASAQVAAAGLKVTCAPLQAYEPDSPFDRITASHVLEHLHAPLDALKTFHGWLRPGGEVWLSLPNPGSVGHKVFGRSWFALDPPRHLFLPQQRQLLRMLEDAGFCDVRLVRRGRGSRSSILPSIEYVAIRGGRNWRRLGGLLVAAIDWAGSILPGVAEETVVIARRGE